MSQKYEKLSKEIIEKVGGSNNISDVYHCQTRLRFKLKDESIAKDDVLHPVAITATVAQSTLAAINPLSREWIEKFWNTPMRTGVRRYYDNCLYFFAFLALSGNYRIW